MIAKRASARARLATKVVAMILLQAQDGGLAGAATTVDVLTVHWANMTQKTNCTPSLQVVVM